MSQNEYIIEKHKEYLEMEKHPNDIIIRFINDLSDSFNKIETDNDATDIIDIEFGYRVLLSFFCEELNKVLKNDVEFKDIDSIYCACLRATDLNQIDSALLAMPASESNKNKFNDFLKRERKFKKYPVLETNSEGLFSIVSKSEIVNHLIYNQKEVSDPNRMSITWYNGKDFQRIMWDKNPKGPLKLLPEWDTMLCSKINNLGGHLGIGYQFFFLNVNFKKEVEIDFQDEFKIESLYRILSENNKNIINTFSILNSLLLSTDIRKLISIYSKVRLTGLMAMNFRHTLRKRLESAIIESFTFVNKCFPNWSEVYNKGDFSSLSQERIKKIDNESIKIPILDIKRIEGRNNISEDNLNNLLEAFNVIVREIDANKDIQKSLLQESISNPDSKLLKPFKLNDLFTKLTEYIQSDEEMDLKIYNLVRPLQLNNPIILEGVIFNIVLNAYSNCPKNGYLIFKGDYCRNNISNKNDNEIVILEIINQISDADYKFLKSIEISELFKPFKIIKGKKKGMGLYYSYILLKEYFIESGIKIELMDQIEISNSPIKSSFFKATIKLKNIGK